MSGEKADVKHYDLKQMENFRDNEVQSVHSAAKKHREEGDGSTIRPLLDLLDGYTTPENLGQDKQLLCIGRMGTETLVSGPKLIEGTRTAAEAVDKLLGDQMALFKEMKEALSETIEGGDKTKDKNLDGLEAQTLLQDFDKVDALTAGGTGGTGAPGDKS